MKLLLVLSAWFSLFAVLYVCRSSLAAGREALLNFANGFINVFHALLAFDLRGRSNCSPTLGECVGFAVGLVAVAIPIGFLYHFFLLTLGWAINAS